MATSKWNDGSDDWNTAADWSTGAVPTSADDVAIAESAPQISSNVGTVASVVISSNGAANNAGLSLVNGSDLTVAGDLRNGGALTLHSVGVFFVNNESTTASLKVNGNIVNTGDLLIQAQPGTVFSRGPFSEVTANSFFNTGSVSLEASQLLIGISTGSVSLHIKSSMQNDGTITSNNSSYTLVDGAVSGAGSFLLNSNSRLEIGGADSNNIRFGPEMPSIIRSLSTTLKLDAPSLFAGAISNFGNGDTIDLANEVATSVSYAGSTASVTLADGSIQEFTVTGDFTDLAIISDGSGGTNIVVCFATGTHIATARGNITVEDLQKGDFVVTSSGVLRPVVWIGSREIRCSSQPTGFAVWPVRVRAGAFGGSLPARDLFLSPGHPVLVGNHLVPIMCLINGTTIEHVPVETVTYWHIELDQHDILLAEGLPVESYLDWGDRCFFSEGTEHALMNPDFVVPGLAGRCRPVAIDGPVVEAERRRLNTVFEISLLAQCEWPTGEEANSLWATFD